MRVTLQGGPFAVPQLARGAHRDWAGEAAVGAGFAVTQLPVASMWPCSAASLVSHLVTSLPLIKLACPIVVTCLLPAAKLGAAIIGLLSAGLTALLLPLVTLLGSGLSGATGTLGSSGIAFWLSDALRGLATAVTQQILVCFGLQRSLARHYARKRARAESMLYEDGTIVFVKDWRTSDDAMPRRRARLISCAAAAAFHSSTAPDALTAGVMHYVCFAHLFERRGLASAVGAHLAHGAIAAGLKLTPTGSLLLPCVVYVLFGLRALAWVRVQSVPKIPAAPADTSPDTRRDG